jgi:hypothetical protein
MSDKTTSFILKDSYRPEDLIGLEFVTIQNNIPVYLEPEFNSKKMKLLKKGERTGKILGFSLIKGFKTQYMYLTDRGFYIYPKADHFNIFQVTKEKGIKSKGQEIEKREKEEEKPFFDKLTDKILPLAFILIGGKILLSSTQNKKQ